MRNLDLTPLYDRSGSLRYLYDLDQPLVDRKYVLGRMRSVFLHHAMHWKVPRSFLHVLDWHKPLQPASKRENDLFALWRRDPDGWISTSAVKVFCNTPLAWDDRDFALQLFLCIARRSDRFDIAFAASCWSRNPLLAGEWVRLVSVREWQVLFRGYPGILGFWTKQEWVRFSLLCLGTPALEMRGEGLMEMVADIPT